MTRFPGTRTGLTALVLAGLLSLGIHGALVTAAQERSNQSQISGITPPGKVQEKAPQTLTVSGKGFADGLTLEITSPEGQMNVLSGRDIQELKDTAFLVSVWINHPGNYTFIVKNANGSASNAFSYKVPAVTKAPGIERVDPSSVPRDTKPQRFTVVGRDFEPGLSVTLTDPAGEVTTITRDQIGTVTPTSFTVDLTLGMAGDYSLLVTNPSTAASNSVTITATAARR